MNVAGAISHIAIKGAEACRGGSWAAGLAG
jgi:hypothetical protein